LTLMTRGQELRPGALARRLMRAPRLVDAAAARKRVAAWLAMPAGTAPAALVDAMPPVRALIEGIADGSPYLWDLIERDGARMLTLCNPIPTSIWPPCWPRPRAPWRQLRTTTRRCGCCGR